MKQFDIVVLGATGFTGRLVCEHIVNSYHNQKQFTWAMAGRSEAKLEQMRHEIGLGSENAADVALLLADVNDAESMNAMASAAWVVINTVGPFAKYGHGVVKACIENGAHYCDLAGEVQFIMSTVEEFNEAAKAKGVKIVHSCGFDSLPSDVLALMAAHHMRTKHGKELAEVTAVLGRTAAAVSGGTVESVVGFLRASAHDKELARKAAHPYCLVPNLNSYTESDLPDAGAVAALGPAWSPAARCWTGPFIVGDHNEKVVRMTNALLGWKLGKSMKYSERKGTGLFGAIGGTVQFAVLGGLLMLASKWPWLRRKLPQPGEGPSRAVMESGHWSMQTWALSHELDTSATRHRVTAKMSDAHRDPAYLSTSRMILECALCLIPQNHKLLEADPYAGICPAGVMSPCAAVGLTVQARLQDSGFELSVEDIV